MTNGILTDTKSITLYTFDRDVVDSGKSTCNGECARNWLPFYAPPGAMVNADYQIITRDDGKAQWAIKGKPLYYWPEDQEPGDKYGDGYNNLWRLIGVAGPVTLDAKRRVRGLLSQLALRCSLIAKLAADALAPTRGSQKRLAPSPARRLQSGPGST